MDESEQFTELEVLHGSDHIRVEHGLSTGLGAFLFALVAIPILTVLMMLMDVILR